MPNLKPRIPNTIQHPTRGKLVCRIFDYGDTVADRYTIAFRAFQPAGSGRIYPYLASGPSPFHPLGFGQYNESDVFLTGKHLGKRVRFEALPVEVQEFIMQTI